MNYIKIRKALENILFKASTDKEYRRLCLTNGTEAFSQESDIDLGKTKIKFIENVQKDFTPNLKGKEIVFVLADFVGPIVKLNKDDLNKIQGGFGLAKAIERAVSNNIFALDDMFNVLNDF